MRKLKTFWTIVAIIISVSSWGQGYERDERNYNCKERNKFDEATRLKNYPFSVASEVRLISFDNRPDSLIEHSLPEINGKVDMSKLSEQIPLTKPQVDSLIHILFNIGYRGKISTLESGGCYNPRNAILFVDSTAQTFEFIEICFECNGFRLSSESIATGDFCSQKYQILKDFFILRGIKIGTVKDIRER